MAAARLSVAILACALYLSGTVQDVQGRDAAKDWWQKTVFYQIYPRSFKDSDGDGIGDLNGITEQMDHFVDAGIGAVWLSPIFQSPMVDFGYDISDFRAIQKEYGTMEDFDNLIAKAKKLKLKVILDFVPNHASNESDYFKLSLNKTAGYEDFFIWDDGKVDPNNSTNRLPPSNWVSQFLGSAWEWNSQRGQYYLRQFSKQQPDLNYRNPAVLAEMNSVMTFWLDKGVDGFRIDALPYLMEADKNAYGGEYPDDPLTGAAGLGPGDLGYTTPIYSKDRLDTYGVVYQWRKLLDDYSMNHDNITRVMLTEGYANISSTMLYYGNSTANGSNIPFNFDFITSLNSKSNARDIVYVTEHWLNYMPSGKTANWVLGNHDNKRMASRFGSHMVDPLNMLEFMLPGVAITWQGDEIGMEDGYVSYEDTVDVSGCSAGIDKYTEFSRDPERTPFQWDDTTNAGFSTANKTWLPVASNYKTLNLKSEKEAARSHYKVYQALTAMKSNITLLDGDLNIKALSDNMFALTRTLDGQPTYSFVANMGPNNSTADLSLFRELSDVLTVHIASANSLLNPNDTVRKDSINLTKGEAIIFTSRPQPTNC